MLTDPADVLKLFRAHVVGMDDKELVVGVQQMAQLLIILHNRYGTFSRRLSSALGVNTVRKC